MTDLCFVGHAPVIGRIPVELHVDLDKYRGMTPTEITASLRGSLRDISRLTGVDVEVNQRDIAMTAVQIAATANLTCGELSVPQAVPEYVEDVNA